MYALVRTRVLTLSAPEILMTLNYEANSKHKEPWQPGRKGTLCPHWDTLQPEQLIRDESILINKKRYAVHNGMAFVAQKHRETEDTEYWHGYPEGWENIPPQLRRLWQGEEKVTKRQIKALWARHDVNNFLEENE